MSALGVSDIALGLRQRRGGPVEPPGFSPASLFAGGEQGAWFDPSDLGSMFEDSGGTVPAAVDGSVGLIRDKSGRGNDASQATASARPLLRLDEEGRHFLEFDGVDDALVASFAIGQPMDRISALRQIGWTLFGRLLAGVPNAVGLLYQGQSSPSVTIQSNLTGPSSASAALGSDVVVTERHHGSSSRLAIGDEAYAAGDPGTLAADGLVLGNRATRDRGANIRLYGVMVRAGLLSDEQVAAVRGFMAGKLGVGL